VEVGVGLIPNDELARAAGLECEGGVIVDPRCVSSDPDILAAGDVAVTPNRVADGNRQFAVHLTAVTGAAVGRANGVGTIIDDD